MVSDITDGEQSYQRWERHWPRDHSAVVVQVCTGHSVLVAACLLSLYRASGLG